MLGHLNLNRFVTMHSSLDLAAAHTLFEPDSLGMVCNDVRPFLIVATCPTWH